MEFSGLAADSREVEPGFLFAALKGAKTDGGRFIEEAVRRGAVAVLGAPELAEQARKLGVRFIADTNPRLQARAHGRGVLRAPAEHASPPSPAPTARHRSRHFLRQIWSSQGRKAASVGTLGVYSPQRPCAACATRRPIPSGCTLSSRD